MLNRNWSISSRTGYEPQTASERIHEAIAILLSMVVVFSLIAAIILISRLF